MNGLLRAPQLCQPCGAEPHSGRRLQTATLDRRPARRALRPNEVSAFESAVNLARDDLSTSLAARRSTTAG